jgi:hypothetical protein
LFKFVVSKSEKRTVQLLPHLSSGLGGGLLSILVKELESNVHSLGNYGPTKTDLLSLKASKVLFCKCSQRTKGPSELKIPGMAIIGHYNYTHSLCNVIQLVITFITIHHITSSEITKPNMVMDHEI